MLAYRRGRCSAMRWNQGWVISLCEGLQPLLEFPWGQLVVKIAAGTISARESRERLRRGDLINISEQGSQIHSQSSPGPHRSPQVTQSTCLDQAQTQTGGDQTAHKNVPRLFSRGEALWEHARSANNKQKQEAEKKGYRHLLHKLILRVVRLGEVLDVVLQPLDLALHVGQVALQDLSGHCEETGETSGRCEHVASQTKWMCSN